MDYLFRWMELRFLSGKQLPLFGQGNGEISAGDELTPGPADGPQFLHDMGDGPPCGLWRLDEAQRNLSYLRQLWPNQRMFLNAWMETGFDEMRP